MEKKLPKSIWLYVEIETLQLLNPELVVMNYILWKAEFSFTSHCHTCWIEKAL